MKKFFLGFVIILITFSLNAQKLTIYHTNDVHSKLTGYGPESEYTPLSVNDDLTKGGFARLATVFNHTEKKNENKLVVDAGDFLMGSLFHVAEEETGFQMNLMKEIGYDIITLGNHEFDFGPKVLANILNNAEEKGGYPEIISSNLIFSDTEKGDDELYKLYTSGKIKPYTIVEKAGIKIAIFGLVGIDAAEVAPSSYPVQFEKPVKAAKNTVQLIQEKENPDMIICLSHSGIYPTKDGEGFEGEDFDLAEKVDGIDIIISGHTHVKTDKPIKVNNTYIVQTGSYAYNVGKIDMLLKDKSIKEFDFKLIPVDDKIKGDPTIQKKIEEHIEFINKNYLAETGLTYNTKIAKLNYDLKTDYMNPVQSNIGSLIADADLYYLQSKGIDVDFSMVAAGTIREDLLKGNKGILTVPDAFRVMSLGEGKDNIPGYPLATIYITAKELKKLCEVLYIARQDGGDSYLFTSGLKIYVNPDKMMLKKVQKVELNGKEIDLSKKNEEMICLAANGYLLSFIGRIKKMTFGLVKVVPKDVDGNPVTDMTKQYCDIDPDKEGIQEAKEWIALIEYMKSFPTGRSKLPVVPDSYMKGDESMFTVSE
jgi:5'-nucleotidase/UDP-sugar diphosphatase